MDLLLAKELLIDDNVLLWPSDRRPAAARKPFDLVSVEKRPGRNGKEEGKGCASEAYF